MKKGGFMASGQGGLFERYLGTEILLYSLLHWGKTPGIA